MSEMSVGKSYPWSGLSDSPWPRRSTAATTVTQAGELESGHVPEACIGGQTVDEEKSCVTAANSFVGPAIRAALRCGGPTVDLPGRQVRLRAATSTRRSVTFMRAVSTWSEAQDRTGVIPIRMDRTGDLALWSTHDSFVLQSRPPSDAGPQSGMGGCCSSRRPPKVLRASRRRGARLLQSRVVRAKAAGLPPRDRS